LYASSAAIAASVFFWSSFSAYFQGEEGKIGSAFGHCCCCLFVVVPFERRLVWTWDRPLFCSACSLRFRLLCSISRKFLLPEQESGKMRRWEREKGDNKRKKKEKKKKRKIDLFQRINVALFLAVQGFSFVDQLEQFNKA
jgi:hypothetical protein